MRRQLALAAAIVSLATFTADGASAAACANGPGPSRVIEIGTSGGPIFGAITKRAKEDRFLKPKEVVLTFDDGPLPWITRSILDTLDRHCAKATFFQVGRMAVAYPAVVRDILARGHTIGGHTWSHPLNLPRLKAGKAEDEIEKGLAAVSLAAGRPVAPFFRFTGLSDSDRLLAYLQSRGIASFTVDVVSDDSYIGDADKLARITLERIESQQGGIVLFHDIKAATAKALPVILKRLEERGYRFVHLRSKTALEPVKTYDAELTPLVTKALVSAGEKKLMPFYGAAGPEKRPEMAAAEPPATEPPVTEIAPAPRPRRIASAEPATDAGIYAKKKVRRAPQTPGAPAISSGWSTEVRPMKRSVYD